jgi:VWFA-related protein
MNARAARHLRISAAILFGILLVCAGTGRIVPANAQPSQEGASQPPTAPPATTAPAQQPVPANAPEMSTQENPVPLQSRVNLVPVRVIVRDGQGHAVGNLRREDFQLFEDGKPQFISNFTVETLASLPEKAAQPSASSGGVQSGETSAFLPPSRFVTLLFDDPSLTIEDIMRSRDAAGHYIDALLAPTDRVAILTISGQTQMDFTDDRAKLHATLKGLQTRTITGNGAAQLTDCPPMDYYEAVEIQDHHDSQSLAVATQDALICQPPPPTPSVVGVATASTAAAGAAVQQAQELAEATALRIEEVGDGQTEASLRRLREVIDRMSVLPGQRSIVLISPGFIYPNREYEFDEVIDRAIRANVFINALDARGLYTPDLGDISQSGEDSDPATKGFRTKLHLEGNSSQVYALMDLAAGTGGFAVHDNNDLSGGLREIVSAPDTSYLLAFVPQNMKTDGRFHALRVAVQPNSKFTIQARKGFYAPQHGETPQEAAARDIQDALFSQEEQHGLPIALQTQYYKTDATDAKLAILAHVDMSHVRFDKVNGLNQNDLTVVSALFDRNGNFIKGTQKVIEMKLLDATLEKLARTGMTVRTSFDVTPGDYVVRLVVRDSKAALVSAENGAVEIPY